jgi:hypothetical protein
MYHQQFTNNSIRSNNCYLTFKALVEPYYMQGPNPTEPDVFNKNIRLTATSSLIMKETNPHDEIRGSNPSPGAYFKSGIYIT